jgi:hypothetical protein
MDALDKVAFVKNEDVPLVRVHQFAKDDPHDTFIGINVEISYSQSTFLVTLYSFAGDFATKQRVANLIQLAREYATIKNYRLQIDVKPEDYE